MDSKLSMFSNEEPADLAPKLINNEIAIAINIEIYVNADLYFEKLITLDKKVNIIAHNDTGNIGKAIKTNKRVNPCMIESSNPRPKPKIIGATNNISVK